MSSSFLPSSPPPPIGASVPSSGPSRKPRVLLHLDDVRKRIAAETPNSNLSIKTLKQTAEQRWSRSLLDIETGRFDLAFVDFNVALHILVELIPKHQEWPTWSSRYKSEAERYRALRQQMYQKIAYFEEVKEKIAQDNAKNQTLSQSAVASQQNGRSQPRSSIDLLSYPPTDAPNGTAASSGISKKKAPPPPVKPDSLKNFHSSDQQNGHTAPDQKPTSRPGSSQGDDADLRARFQALRTNGGSPSPSETLRRKGALSGSRDLPKRAILNTDGLGMPKPPSPTYSPVRQYASTPFGSVSSGPRPLVRTSSSLSTYSETAGSSTPLPVPSSSTTLPTSSGRSTPDPSNGISRKVVQSKETQVTAERLSEYMSSRASILVIDVRVRSEFDEGHLHVKNIICIEPMILRDGVTSTGIEESLSISPDKELQLYMNRHTFDLVVFHDKSTTNLRHTGGPHKDPAQRVLQNLVEAIWTYEQDKYLKAPPLLLVGGIDAWIELNGPASLAFASQFEKPPAQQKPLGRSNARGGGIAQRRKLRQPIPGKVMVDGKEDLNVAVLGSGHEEEWTQTGEGENEITTMSPPGYEGKQRRRTTSVVSSSSVQFEHPRNIEDFFKRFPSLNQIESMTNAPPMPQGPPPPPQRHPPPPPPLESPYSSTSEYRTGDSMYEKGYSGEPSPTTSNRSSSPGLRRRNTIIDHPFHGFTDVRNPAFNPPASPSRPAPVVPRKSYGGVSERHQPPPLALDESIKSLGPHRPPLPTVNAVQTTRIGLKNLGNTCYMNSILQCMSGTVPLARYFLGGDYIYHLNKDNKLGSGGRFVNEFAKLNRTLWNGNMTFTSPNVLKELSGRLNDQFEGFDQQDAQEFLGFFLDYLHEDLNPNAGKVKFPPLTEAEERNREAMPVQLASYYEWQRYTQTNQSVIVDWFQGQYRSRLKCLNCGHTSTTYNAFMYLSLPIPVGKPADKCSLIDCMNEFTKEEILDGDDKWHCPVCKSSQKSTKKLSISRLPFVLIIHLKRFTTKGRWRDKLTNLVEFGMDLNLTPYVPPLMQDGPVYKAPPVTSQALPPFHYQLYAVANHIGNLSSGHYTALVKDAQRETWHRYDDSKVSAVENTEVVSKQAYVLFWVRKNVM